MTFTTATGYADTNESALLDPVLSVFLVFLSYHVKNLCKRNSLGIVSAYPRVMLCLYSVCKQIQDVPPEAVHQSFGFVL